MSDRLVDLSGKSRSYLTRKLNQMELPETDSRDFDSEQINILFKSHKDGGYFKNELITLFMFQVWYEQMLKC